MIVRGAWSKSLGLHERVISGTTGCSVLPLTFVMRNATLFVFLLQTGLVRHITKPTNQTCFDALVVLGCFSLVVGLLFLCLKF